MTHGNDDNRILNAPMNRRQFCQLVTVMGALGYIDNIQAAFALETNTKRLGWRAFRTPGAEGVWELTEVEGTVPAELDGTLYRTAPGLKEYGDITLQHLFDGDAFVSGYTIRDGKVTLRANFVQTPQRVEEQAAGRMLYDEYGTHAPKNPDGTMPPRLHQGKNQPSVNIIPWDGRLLGLSEGGHPTAINPKTLQFEKYWDFYGTLPEYMSFTAHPRFDPVTGVAYTYGMAQNATLAMNVYRMELNGKLTQLHSVPMHGYYMVHDMLLSQNYMIFVVPPVKYNFVQLVNGTATPAEALGYFEAEGLKLIVLSRDGSGEPIIVEQPSNMVFHHGNAFERDGKIVIDSMLTPDGSILNLLANFANDTQVPYATAQLTRIVIDPATKSVVSRDVLGNDQEFPRFDQRMAFKDATYLYAMENGVQQDQLAFTRLVKTNLQTGEISRIDAEPERALGEPVFVPHPDSTLEDRGWILQLGYDGNTDRTYLEIRDAQTMEFQARAWTNTHLPLGFHGNWVSGWHIEA